MAAKGQWMDRLTGRSNEGKYPLIWALLLIGILMIGAYFRFTGVNWDESQHLHPDERFMTMVASSISSVDSLDDYFNTAKSTLNPHNMGYGFYVYGTLPLFLVRWVAEAVNQAGYDEIFLVGRVLSGFADLITVLIVYLTALRLFRRQRLALIAAAFMALSVMPIQLSHYFTVDNFANLFTMLAIYFAVRVFTGELPSLDEDGEASSFEWRDLVSHWPSAVPYALFGVGLGLALASKVSIAPLAVLLPLAAVVYFFRLTPQQQSKYALVLLRNLVIGAVVSFIIFRIFQPYAFSGPGFFGIGLNQKWFDNLSSLQAQSSGDVDSPPELQWARRPITFAWTNMVEWGMGLPLGLLAWAGFLWMGWRILRGEWKPYLLIWLWTGAYFAWQALSFTRTMRYQIPVYPTLAIIAAWAIFALWDHRSRWKLRLPERVAQAWPKVLSLLVGLAVLLSTFAWAFAFTRIYNRPMTRVEATRWIYQNVPAPINLHIQTDVGQVNQPIPYLNDGAIEPDEPYVFTFTAPVSGAMAELTLPGLTIQHFDPVSAFLKVEITDVTAGNKLLASGSLPLAFENKEQTYTIPLDTLAAVQENQVYGVVIYLQAQRGSVLLTKDIPIRIYTRTSVTEVALNQINLQGVTSHTARFTSKLGGSLRWLSFPVKAAGSTPAATTLLSVTVMEPGAGGKVVGALTQMVEATAETQLVTFRFEPQLLLIPAREYVVIIDNTTVGQSITLNGTLSLRTADDSIDQSVPYPVRLIRQGNPYMAMVDIKEDGVLTEVQFARLAQQDPALAGALDLSVDVMLLQKPDVVLASGKVQTMLDPAMDTRGAGVTVKLDQPLAVTKGNSYFIRLSVTRGAVAVRGSAPANEIHLG